MDLAQLELLDRGDIQAIDVITPEGRKANTSSQARTFIGMDGKTYWVKGTAQHGLAGELIAGRLAARLAVGPNTVIIRLHPALIPDNDTAHFPSAFCLGSEDAKGAENARDMQGFLANGSFKPENIDAASRARVIVFQSWIGVDDIQALVHLASGRVLSIDHGDCFRDLSLVPPTVRIATIPGVPDEVGRDKDLLLAAVGNVEALLDGNLLEAVACMPPEDNWKGDRQRRLDIANFLAFRRGRLKEVFE